MTSSEFGIKEAKECFEKLRGESPKERTLAAIITHAYVAGRLSLLQELEQRELGVG